MAKHTHNHDVKIPSTVARDDDGGLQITFSIPSDVIAHEEFHALEEMSTEMTVPGFRKGKAPMEKVKATVAPEKLTEKTLMRILPKAFSDAMVENKLRPAMYPRFEIISQEDPWQVRALTCEVPDFELGDYKDVAKGVLAADAIWTPDKGDPTKKTEQTREEKEQKVIEALISSTKITIPKMMIEEEVNARLSQLLGRIEKLGLNLDSYLGSIGKTPESLREEYEAQTIQALSLELILNKIAEEEKVEINSDEIDKVMDLGSADPNLKKKLEDPSQRQFIASVLRRRAVLDRLITS